MKEILQTAFGLLGGLAIFIYGMNMMSDGLQKAAGEKMKKIIGILTKNPILGIIAGTITTAVLQSSSATTCMVIGFVSAGLMTLPQAISVILGANIGTTMTAQLLAFKIGDYIYPLVFIGFIIYFVSKNERIKNLGQTIFAFGLLFVGIETMGSVMKPLASSPVFISMIERVKDVPILGVAVGALMTLVVQSSSATIAVLQNFAATPGADGTSVLGLAGAIPILLGDNIGTTITAILASIGQSKDAKRTAIAHSIFNIVGSLIFICIIPLFARFIVYISPKGNEIDVISRQIANAHTIFNVTNTLLWLPFIWLMYKIVMFIIPDKGDEEKAGSRLAGINVAKEPAFAIYLASQELIRCADIIKVMIANIKKAVADTDVRIIAATVEDVKNIGDIQKHLVKFMSKLVTAGSLTQKQSAQVFSLMEVERDFERIVRRVDDIVDILADNVNQRITLSAEAQSEVGTSVELINNIFVASVDALTKGEIEKANEIINKDAADSIEKKYTEAHKKRVEEGRCKPELTVSYRNLLHCIERIGKNSENVSKLAVDGVNFAELEKQYNTQVG